MELVVNRYRDADANVGTVPLHLHSIKQPSPMFSVLNLCIFLQAKQGQHMGEAPLVCPTALWPGSYGWTSLGWRPAWGLM